MTNADLQAFVAKYGNRTCYIVCDNMRRIPVNFPGQEQHMDAIEYQTVGECDMFCFPRTERWQPGPNGPMNGKKVGQPVKIREWHLTECIQSIIEVDDPEFLPDLIKII